MQGGPLALLGLLTALGASGAPLRLARADAPLRVGMRIVPAQVSPRLPELQKATEQVDSGDFEEAIKTLQQGLSQPDLTDDQLAEMYRLLGLAHLYLGNEDKARDAFEKLLQARPDYELPRSAPPKIRSLYGRIKDDIKKRRVRPVTLTVSVPERLPGGHPVVISAHVEDLSLGARAKLFFRRRGEGAYSSVDFARSRDIKEDFTATIPAYLVPNEDNPYELECYVEVADAAQRRLAGKGDTFNPLLTRIDASARAADAVEESSAWYRNPWVWVGVVAGAAAITTTVVVLATQRQTGTLPITVRIEGQ